MSILPHDNGLVKQLTALKMSCQYFDTSIPEGAVMDYIRFLLYSDQVIWRLEGTEVVGYLEYWRMTYEVLGRHVCGKEVILDELTVGPVAYVSNLVVKYPDDKKTFPYLSSQFFDTNRDAEVFSGRRQGRRHKPIVTYANRHEGVYHG